MWVKLDQLINKNQSVSEGKMDQPIESAPIECCRCHEVAAYRCQEGYVCEECGHLHTWSFFKVCKMKSTDPKDQEELKNEFWQNVPPYAVEKEFNDFQI